MGMTLTKRHKEAIAAIERDGITVTPLRYSRGGHLMLAVERGDIRGTVTVAASASDHRATRNILSCARQQTSVASAVRGEDE